MFAVGLELAVPKKTLVIEQGCSRHGPIETKVAGIERFAVMDVDRGFDMIDGHRHQASVRRVVVHEGFIATPQPVDGAALARDLIDHPAGDHGDVGAGVEIVDDGGEPGPAGEHEIVVAIHQERGLDLAGEQGAAGADAEVIRRPVRLDAAVAIERLHLCGGRVLVGDQDRQLWIVGQRRIDQPARAIVSFDGRENETEAGAVERMHHRTISLRMLTPRYRRSESGALIYSLA